MSKVVFITGASSGLGLAHAIYLTSLGYKVIGTSRKAETLDMGNLRETFLRDHARYSFVDPAKREVKAGEPVVPTDLAQKVSDYLDGVQFVSMDVTNDKSVKQAIDKVEASTPIDVLINNAGCAHWGSVEEVTINEAQDLFEINFFGQVRVLQAVIPLMRARKSGQIINTTSLAALAGIPFGGFYSAAKAGIERITEALYTELKPYSIRVSSLLPGDINTAVDANMAMRQGKSDQALSTDVGAMLDAVPTPKSSPYFSRSQTVWEIFIRNHIMAPAPLLVSQQIVRIIEAHSPKVHYQTGTFMQAGLLPLLKATLPGNVFLDTVAHVFGI
jgi:NAD(P)-dependent dehydrogenase (short-subunit alcohol dehydrogenase family)